MNDCIERKKAIELIQPHVKPQTVYGKGYLQAIEHATDILELMPAADVQPVDRWISVDDRLPEIGKSVLVIVSINAKVNLPLCTDLALEMRIGWLDDNGKWGLQFDSADRDEILYWMPLPEPPKDGETNG